MNVRILTVFWFVLTWIAESQGCGGFTVCREEVRISALCVYLVMYLECAWSYTKRGW